MSTLNPQRSRAEMLLHFLSDSETLNEWEADFVFDLISWWEKHGFLTEGQMDKLEQVNEQDEGRR
jgi:hypothetical protein